MPTYAYACTACEHRFEIVQSFSDDSLADCPECQGRLRKLFNAVGVVFKGSGFYRNDSRNDSGKSARRGTDRSSRDGSAKDSRSGSDPAGAPASSSESGSNKSAGSPSSSSSDSGGSGATKTTAKSTAKSEGSAA